MKNFNRWMNRYTARPLAIACALMSFVGLAALSLPSASAATGIPNITSLTDLRCGQDQGALLFGGTLRRTDGLVIRLSRDVGTPALAKQNVSVLINGTTYLASGSGDDYQLPDWNPQNGQPTTFLFSIRNLPAGQTVHFDARAVGGVTYGNLADGWSDQKECSISDSAPI